MIAQQCTEAADGEYEIEMSVLPRDASAQREQLARRLAAKDSSIDIMSLDPPFIPEMAEPGFLAPVPDDVAQRVSENVVAGALAGATWGDKLVTVPFWANTQLLWYRKSVASAAGLDPATTPVTWDQIMDASKDQDKYLAVQGTKAESLTVWINALVASAGGKILENPEAPADQIKLGLETPAGEAAATIIGTIGKEGLGGPALPTEDENASLSIFQGDKGSFMVNWPFVWSATKAGVEDGTFPQALLDDIGWALYPQVSADQHDRTAVRRDQPRRRRVQQARRPRVRGRGVHRHPGAPGALLRDERQPAVQHRGVRRPGGHRGVPHGGRHPGVARARRAAAADAVLQRGVHRAAADLAPAELGESRRSRRRSRRT